jgi:polar amino acid transport system substrate-binding protein
VRFAWIDERPFSYEVGGVVTGCDVELARRAFAALGHPFEPIHTTFDELLPGIRQDRWHVTTGMFVTAERQAQAFFTRPIWSLRDGLLVAHPKRYITGYTALAREQLKVAVLKGQVQRDHALRLGIDPAHLVEFDSYAEAAAAVLDGRVAAYASVALAHEEHLSTLPQHERGLAICVPVPPAEVAPAPGAFACASAELRDALDQILAEMLGPGTPGEPVPDPPRASRHGFPS